MTSASGHTTSGVAAGHRATAQAAAEVLSAGGNAFDAALAGMATACVAEPVLASLGGGGFLAARTKDGATTYFDFFAHTPKVRPRRSEVNFHPIEANFGTATQEFHIGTGAIATPGVVAGIFEVHDALGQMPVRDIFAPAISFAKDGIALNDFQSYLLGVVSPIYQATDAAGKLYFPNGRPSGAGDVLDFGAFADFLTHLADEGPACFYEGEIARKIADLPGGVLSLDDLSGYQVIRRTPLSTDIFGHTLFVNPAPSIGGALIAYTLERLQQTLDHSEADGGSVACWVTAMEECRQARHDSKIDLQPAGSLSALRQARAHPPSYRGTTHISVADAAGNLAALTISNGEGCGHLVPGTGIMLNNMLGEEDLNASGFFNWRPDTRLSSMMSPGFLEGPNGAVTAFGSGGSNRIRSALSQVIFHLTNGAPVGEAVEAPRVHLDGTILSLEPGLDLLDTTAEGTGYSLQRWLAPNMFFGGAHIVRRSATGEIEGAGDPRRDGLYIAV